MINRRLNKEVVMFLFLIPGICELIVSGFSETGKERQAYDFGENIWQNSARFELDNGPASWPWPCALPYSKLYGACLC
jgi:hypothetical protein